MQYKAFREKGYQIGSVIESALNMSSGKDVNKLDGRNNQVLAIKESGLGQILV